MGIGTLFFPTYNRLHHPILCLHSGRLGDEEKKEDGGTQRFLCTREKTENWMGWDPLQEINGGLTSTLAIGFLHKVLQSTSIPFTQGVMRRALPRYVRVLFPAKSSTIDNSNGKILCSMCSWYF
uniref:Uncharacterized protein n=1 Tax=Pyxicephalus adspersus TaxID=30357 RepID=A0AAV3A7G7_PYXAD|nr:TPA: hypothetical protein GDO54_014452 [Pyxicephalus adspersus]